MRLACILPALLLIAPAAEGQMQEYAVARGARPHDVAPAVDGGVWFTAQRSGELGWLDIATGAVVLVPPGSGSAPHGAMSGQDKLVVVRTGNR